MPEKTSVEFDDAMLERLERYVVQGDEALRDPVVAQLVAAHPRMMQQLRDILATLRMRSHDAAETSLAGAIRRLGQESVVGTQTVRTISQKKRVFSDQPLRRHLWFTSAAFVLGILVAVVSWTTSTHVGHRGTSSSLTYTTGNGERATITLPDAGTVMLNVASRLEVPADYFAGNHTVRLVGEGVFTVQHHAGAPLTVLAGPAAVRVLGTSFLVRKYATDSAATVVVRDGKVAIRSVVLTAAQQVAVSRTGLSRVQFADSTQFNFTRGVLTLDDVLFPEAIMELDRWYDADIRLGNPRLATLRMTVEVGAGSLAELSDNLEHTYKVRVVRHGRVLTLYPGQ